MPQTVDLFNVLRLCKEFRENLQFWIQDKSNERKPYPAAGVAHDEMSKDNARDLAAVALVWDEAEVASALKQLLTDQIGPSRLYFDHQGVSHDVEDFGIKQPGKLVADPQRQIDPLIGAVKTLECRARIEVARLQQTSATTPILMAAKLHAFVADRSLDPFREDYAEHLVGMWIRDAVKDGAMNCPAFAVLAQAIRQRWPDRDFGRVTAALRRLIQERGFRIDGVTRSVRVEQMADAVEILGQETTTATLSGTTLDILDGGPAMPFLNDNNVLDVLKALGEHECTIDLKLKLTQPGEAFDNLLSQQSNTPLRYAANWLGERTKVGWDIWREVGIRLARGAGFDARKNDGQGVSHNLHHLAHEFDMLQNGDIPARLIAALAEKWPALTSAGVESSEVRRQPKSAPPVDGTYAVLDADQQSNQGYMGLDALARHFKIPAGKHEALRKRLDRFRAKNALSGDLFIEHTGRARNEPRYLYNPNAIHRIIADMIPTQASDESSVHRPSPKQ